MEEKVCREVSRVWRMNNGRIDAGWMNGSSAILGRLHAARCTFHHIGLRLRLLGGEECVPLRRVGLGNFLVGKFR